MIGFVVIVIIGILIGYFLGRTYHNRYGLSNVLNSLIGLAGAFLAAWLVAGSFDYTNWRVWLAAIVGAMLFVLLASFLRSTQYE